MSYPSLKALASMSLANVATGEVLEAQFNPTTLEDTLSVDYTRLTVPGLSHKVLQYVGTGNVGVPVELYCNANTEDTARAILSFRNFIDSLCYASASAQDIRGGAPPRVLFVWPNLASLTCVILKRQFTYENFAPDGSLLRYKAQVELEEIRDFRLTSEEVRERGLLRASMGVGHQGG